MLYFVDESGIDLKRSPCLVLAGVSIPEAKVWPMAREFNGLMRECLRFPLEMPYEIKGSKLLKRRVFRQAASIEPMALAERAEAIDRLLAKNDAGDRASAAEVAALAQAKLDFVGRALDLASEFEMKVFASVVPRDAPRQEDRSILRKDFSYLFQRIHCHVCDQNGSAHGVMIFDEQDPALSQRLLDQIHRYFVDTDRGRQRAERMIPIPFFVHSDLTPAIQIADLVAYIINWGLRMPRMSEEAREELKPLADRVFAMRYRGREVPLNPTTRRARRTWGIAYIPDLRPRTERSAVPAQVGEPEDGDLDSAA